MKGKGGKREAKAERMHEERVEQEDGAGSSSNSLSLSPPTHAARVTGRVTGQAAGSGDSRQAAREMHTSRERGTWLATGREARADGEGKSRRRQQETGKRGQRGGWSVAACCDSLAECISLTAVTLASLSLRQSISLPLLCNSSGDNNRCVSRRSAAPVRLPACLHLYDKGRREGTHTPGQLLTLADTASLSREEELSQSHSNGGCRDEEEARGRQQLLSAAVGSRESAQLLLLLPATHVGAASE